MNKMVSTSLLRPFGVILMLAAACALAVAEPEGERTPLPEALEERIQQLRAEGRYEEAVEVAAELLSVRRAQPDAASFELEDAESLVTTLEQVTELSSEAQAELARADSLTGLLLECWEADRFEEAIPAVRRQLELRRKHLGTEHAEVAVSLHCLAGFLTEKGDYPGAETAYEEALDLRLRLLGDGHPEVAATLGDFALLHHLWGHFSEAGRLYAEALAGARGAYGDDHPEVATLLINLAILAKQAGDYAEAERLVTEALVVFEELYGSEHDRIASCLDILSDVCWQRGEHAEAERLCRESLAMRRRLWGDDHRVVGTSLTTLGDYYEARGEYASAEPLYREALSVFKRVLGAEHPATAYGLNSLAFVLYHQGNYAEAERLIRESLDIRRKTLGEDHRLVGVSLTNLAAMRQQQGDHVGALPLYREALEISKAVLGPDHRNVAVGLHNIGTILMDQGDFATADAVLREALEMSRGASGDKSTDVSHFMLSLAQNLMLEGKNAEAESLYTRALGISEELLGEYHPEMARALYEVGRFYGAIGDYGTAEAVLTRAAASYDYARLRAGTGTSRAAFLSSPYAELAAAKLAQGVAQGAWMAAERSLGRVLAELLQVSALRTLDSREAALEDSLKASLVRLESECAAYTAETERGSSGTMASSANKARAQLLAAEAEWAAFQTRLSNQHPLTEGGVPSLESVQAVMEDDTALIGWLDTEWCRGVSTSWGYVVRSSGPVVWKRMQVSGEASPRLSASGVRSALARSDSPLLAVSRAGADLWEGRVKPLMDDLAGVRRLVVVPSGAMLGVPIEALEDSEGLPLGDRYAVSYTPSASIYSWLRSADTVNEAGGMLLVGDPPYAPAHLAALADEEVDGVADSGLMPAPDVLRSAAVGSREALSSLPRLCEARTEVQSVARVSSQARLLLGSDATEQEFDRQAKSGELAGWSAIHLATHALVDAEFPERSALILSQVALPDPFEAAVAGSRVYDGIVTAKEILLEWELNADLVTLSACETGLGKEIAGEGYVGFAHALFQAGARCLLLSLWKVDDNATSLLMRRFYENWLGESGETEAPGVERAMSKADALQEAKQWLRSYEDEYGSRPYEHPYYWSAFILIGDAS